MRDYDNIKAVAQLQPDYMGFIFYEHSKRLVGNEFVLPAIDKSIVKVGVFVNQNINQIEKIANNHGIKYLQLHGDETPEVCENLRGKGFSIIKAFSMESDFDFNKLKPYKAYINYFLFDTKGEGYGGTGKSFNWDLLKNYDQEMPFFLSGGISLNNADEALKIKGMNLHAIDVNSGFEVVPGLKDILKLKKLFELRIENY